ncbi:hypothetical protein MKW98_025391 [Papaver atlanticum]|uniref:Late embryogenesis abundant protein n=1 Tax=Papaver atlanticum TaxID=357466 RepID=A0AAD4SE54_9MAGN|nr:hypothetical protein MKW98_025391 [Papaver atlanticum]
MINAFKVVRFQTSLIPLSSSFPSSSASSINSSCRRTISYSSSRFQQANTESIDPDNSSSNMEQQQLPHKVPQVDNPNEKITGDVMSHSFGEGYSTRSDEEGFGGIYGDNQAFPDKDVVHENHPSHAAYDKTQGSEVSEKEKARNQANVQ